MVNLQRLAKIAQVNTPLGVRVKYMPASESSPMANYAAAEMIVPRPDSIENLLVYLHECAHFVLHRNDETTPVYLKEFQAETWARDKIRRAGITLPDELLLGCRRRAANDIRCALKNGIQSLDSSVVDFAWICFEDFERPQIRSLSAQTGFLKS
jgi:hypothetical protein